MLWRHVDQVKRLSKQAILWLACISAAACAGNTQPGLSKERAVVFGELITIGSPLIAVQVSLLPWDASIERLELGEGQSKFVSIDEFTAISSRQSHSGMYTIVSRDGAFGFTRVPLGDYLFVARVGWCADETVRCADPGGFVTRRVTVEKNKNLSVSVCGNDVHIVQVERPSDTTSSSAILPVRNPLCRHGQPRSHTRSDAHRLNFGQSRALGQKVSEETIILLCRSRHRKRHRFVSEVA